MPPSTDNQMVDAGETLKSEKGAETDYDYAGGPLKAPFEKLVGQVIKVKVGPEYLTLRNKDVVTRQLWGTDVYTDDSDMVAILIHTGKVTLHNNPPVNVATVVAYFQVVPGASTYLSTSRNNLKSRSWMPKYQRTSLRLDKVEIEWDQIEPGISRPATKAASTVAGPGRGRSKRRFANHMAVTYNCTNQPCFKYSLGLLSDGRRDASSWTSSRLLNQVMYLEDHEYMYELSRESDSNSSQYDTYRWARVLDPTVFLGEYSIPLPRDEIQVLESHLDWHGLEWNSKSVTIRSKEYFLRTLLFQDIQK